MYAATMTNIECEEVEPRWVFRPFLDDVEPFLSCVRHVSPVNLLKRRASSARLLREDLAAVPLRHLNQLPDRREELQPEVDPVSVVIVPSVRSLMRTTQMRQRKMSSSMGTWTGCP